MKHTRDYYATVEGGRSEALDCSVRAVAVATCSDYEQVHALFKKRGRKDRHRISSAALGNVLTDMIPSTEEYFCPRDIRPTVNQFVKQHPKGHYVLAVRGHFFAVCDGVVHDWKAGPGRKVIFFWRVV